MESQTGANAGDVLTRQHEIGNARTFIDSIQLRLPLSLAAHLIIRYSSLFDDPQFQMKR